VNKKGKNLKYIDLFAGCGGLSLGIENAGFELALALEKSPMACETFYHNFIKPLNNKEEWAKYCAKPLIEQVKEKLVVNELKTVLDNPEAMEYLRKLDIDLVAGGPPCQGFSMAGRRNPKDARNQLPWQFMEFIEKVNPKAVIMENVVGITRDFSKENEKAPFNQLKETLENLGEGYFVQPVQLNAMHFGVPEHRPRMMLLGIRKDIAENKNMYFSDNIWKSDYDENMPKTYKNRPDIVPRAKYFGNKIRTVKDAFWDLDNNGYKLSEDDILYNNNGNGFAKLMRSSKLIIQSKNKSSAILPNHINRNHSDKAIKRFRLYQYLQCENIRARIFNIPFEEELTEAEKRATLTKIFTGKKIPAKSPDGQVLANSIDGLVDLVFELATKKHSQRPLQINKPSPTVLTLPDDLIHPKFPRIMTVRELARLQSFPDYFVFKSKETTGSDRRKFEVPQYSQVGNAVAPLVALALGENLIKILSEL